jgi:hypothetical protein
MKYEIEDTGYFEERKTDFITDTNGIKHVLKDTKVIIYNSDGFNAKRVGHLDLKIGQIVSGYLPDNVKKFLLKYYQKDIEGYKVAAETVVINEEKILYPLPAEQLREMGNASAAWEQAETRTSIRQEQYDGDEDED